MTTNEIASGFAFRMFNSFRDYLTATTQLFQDKGSFYDTSLEDIQNKLGLGFIGQKSSFDNPNNLSRDEYLDYGNQIVFPNQEYMRRAIELSADIEKNLDLGEDFDASKLKFSSLPKGIFNFGLAAKGLYRQVEYYDVESKKVINDKLVRKNEDNTFYYLLRGEKKQLQKQQKGTFLVKKNCTDIKVEYDKNAEMFLPYQLQDGFWKPYNGCGVIDKETGEPSKLKYATTIKKVFMYRDKLGGGVSNYCEIYVPISGSGAINNSSQYLPKNLSAIIAAQILEEAGVKCRIYGLRLAQVDNNGVCLAVCLKEFGERFDANRIYGLLGTIRSFRANFLFQSYMYAAVDKNKPSTWFNNASSYPISKDEVAFKTAFTLYKNWLFKNKSSLNYTSKIDNKYLMIIGGGLTSDNLNLNLNTTKKEITDDVYSILDYAGFMLSKNRSNFMKKIIQRKRGEGLNNDAIKKYIAKTITQRLILIQNLSDENKDFETPQKEINDTISIINEIAQIQNQLLK